MKRTLLACLSLCFPLQASSPEQLYRSLDPRSISQHLAFHQLYPDTVEGKQALSDAWKLLGGAQLEGSPELTLLPFQEAIQSLIGLISRGGPDSPPKLGIHEQELIDRLGASLHNRKLAGHSVQDLNTLLTLPADEVDVAHGLLLTLDDPDAAHYEAMLDLMALQVRARLGPQATPDEIIDQINAFLFEELWFRFPPRSLWAEEVDEYTFLPSVLDGRRGVCLGISLLYYAIAQRLDLPLEIITPPGHIYLRYRQGSHVINIETTARGVHLPNEQYLGINTRELVPRTAKEMVGMAFYNQASVLMQQKAYGEAREAYEKALLFSPDNLPTQELWAYACILDGKAEQAKPILRRIRDEVPTDAVTASRLPEDYLEGRCEDEDLATLFLHVDHRSESVREKQTLLQKAVERHPDFRTGWFHLAITWFQLHRNREALECLERCHDLDPQDPVVEYYLAQLYTERLHYPSAWEHLDKAEALCLLREHSPRALRDLRRELHRRSPR